MWARSSRSERPGGAGPCRSAAAKRLKYPMRSTAPLEHNPAPPALPHSALQAVAPCKPAAAIHHGGAAAAAAAACQPPPPCAATRPRPSRRAAAHGRVRAAAAALAAAAHWVCGASCLRGGQRRLLTAVPRPRCCHPWHAMDQAAPLVDGRHAACGHVPSHTLVMTTLTSDWIATLFDEDSTPLPPTHALIPPLPACRLPTVPSAASPAPFPKRQALVRRTLCASAASWRAVPVSSPPSCATAFATRRPPLLLPNLV